MTRPGTSNPNHYRFGDFLLDAASRELRRADKVLTLSPKVFDCLLYLIEHRDRAVGRDELVAAVWGQVNVAEVQLRHLVRKVRHTIDARDSSESSIRTLPRFGYRWIGALRDDTELPEGSPARWTPRSDVERIEPQKRSWLQPSALVALLVATLVAISLSALRLRTAKDEDGIKRTTMPTAVAVLPVESVNIDEDNAWMRLGLMDLMASHLRGAGVVVVPSADIAALDKADRRGTTLAAKVQQAIGPAVVVTPRLARDDVNWVLRVHVTRGGESSDMEARASDVVLATREIADKLLSTLGRRSPAAGSTRDGPEVAEVEQRVEAAWLAGNVSEAQRILNAATDAARATPDIELLSAKIELAGGAASAVHVRLEKMLATVSAETDPVLRSGILNELGAADRQLGQWNLATQRFNESIRLIDRLDESMLLGRAYAGRAAVSALQDRYDDAQADFSRARIAFEVSKDPLEAARTEANEGALEAMRGRSSQALSLLEHAAQGLDRFGDRSWLVNALANMISAQLDLLRPADAFATSQRMDRELTEMGSSVHARIARLQEMPALPDSGHIERAQDLIEELKRDETSRHEGPQMGTVQASEARMALQREQWQKAFDASALAVIALDGEEYEQERSAAWLTKIRALRALHRDHETAIEVRAFSAWAHERETPGRLLPAELAEAEEAWATTGSQSAHELYEIALHTAHERGVPADLAQVVISYGNALMSTGELSRAATVVGQVAPWMNSDFDCALLHARLYQKLQRNELWRSALDQAKALAGERPIPQDVAERPANLSTLATLH